MEDFNTGWPFCTERAQVSKSKTQEKKWKNDSACLHASDPLQNNYNTKQTGGYQISDV